MPFALYVIKFISALLDPLLLLLGFVFVLLILALRNSTHQQRKYFFLPFTVFLIGVTWFSIPAVGKMIEDLYSGRYSTLKTIPDDVDAYVLLSGGSISKKGKWERVYPGPASGMRLLHIHYLYKLKRLPVIVTGGKTLKAADSESFNLTRLLMELGIPAGDLILEEKALTTFGNAVHSAEIIRKKEFKKVVLVTDNIHMRRAAACFRKQGVDFIISVPGNLKKEKESPGPFYSRYLPCAGSLYNFDRLYHEILGLTFYFLTGKI